MSVDAGSIYSEVRIRLTKLQADIVSAQTSYDNFGKHITENATKASATVERRYVASLRKITAQIKNVTELTNSGALSEQEAIKRTLSLKEQELRLIENRAVKEGKASSETITAIENAKRSISSLKQAQELLNKSVTSDKQVAQLELINAKLSSVSALMKSGVLSEIDGIKQTINLRAQKLRLLEQEAVSSAQVSPALVEGIKSEQQALSLLRAEHEKLMKAQERRSETLMEKIPRIASSIFYVTRAVRIVSAGVQALIRPLKNAEAAWEAQEEASQKVLAVYHSTGAAAWTTEKHILDLASGLSKVTKYSDKEIESMEAVLLGFTQIQGVNFDKATEAILNVATIMKYDLTSSAQAVGKALEYPSKMLDGLRRQGFRFTDQQMDMIRALESAGKLEDAQTFILAELEKAYGGAARAVADTDSALRVMTQKSFKELQEQFGKALSESGVITWMRREIKGMADDWLGVIERYNEAQELMKHKAAGTLSLSEQLEVAEQTVIAYEKLQKGQKESLSTKYPEEYARALKRVNELKELIEGKKGGNKVVPREIEFEEKRTAILNEYNDALFTANSLGLEGVEFVKAMASAADKEVSALASLAAEYQDLWGPNNQALLNERIANQKEYNLALDSETTAVANERTKWERRNEIISSYNAAIKEVAIKQGVLTDSDYTVAEAIEETISATKTAIIELSKWTMEYGNADKELNKFQGTLRATLLDSGLQLSMAQYAENFAEINKAFDEAKGKAQNVYDITADSKEYNKALLSAISAKVDALALLETTSGSNWDTKGTLELAAAIKKEKELTSLVSGAEAQRYQIKKEYLEALSDIEEKEFTGELTAEAAVSAKADLIATTLGTTRDWLKEFDRFDSNMLTFKDELLANAGQLNQALFETTVVESMIADTAEEATESVEESTKRAEKYISEYNDYMTKTEEDLTKEIENEQDPRRQAMLKTALAEVLAAKGSSDTIVEIEKRKNEKIDSFDRSIAIEDAYKEIVIAANFSINKQIEYYKNLQLKVAETSAEFTLLQGIIDQLNTTKARDEFSAFTDTVSTVSSYMMDIVDAMTESFTLGIEKELDALTSVYEKERELIENNGLTKKEALDKELADAIAAGDEEAAKDAQRQIDLYALELDYNKKKAALQYKSDMATWQANVINAGADLAMLVLKALMVAPAPNWLMGGLAGIAGTSQVAAVVAAKPTAPVLDTGGLVKAKSGNTGVSIGKGTSEVMFGTSALGDPLMKAFIAEIVAGINAGSEKQITIPIYLKEKVLGESVAYLFNNGLVRLNK